MNILSSADGTKIAYDKQGAGRLALAEDVRVRGRRPAQGEPVLDRAFRILTSFGPADRSLSLISLSARAGLPKATALRIARKLVEWGGARTR